MFDLVPLAGSRRIVANRDRHSSFVAQRLQMQFPGARPVAIAAAAVSADEQPRRLSVVAFPVQTLPAPDALGSELGRVMGHSDVDHGSISRDVISAVGNGFAFTQGREVVYRYLIGLPLGHHLRPPFLKAPTSSFFFVSTEITGSPARRKALTCRFR